MSNNLSSPAAGGVSPLTPSTPFSSPADTNMMASPQLPGAKKRILSENDIPKFQSSSSYKSLILFLGDLSMSVFDKECHDLKPWVPDVKLPSEDAETKMESAKIPSVFAQEQNQLLSQHQKPSFEDSSESSPKPLCNSSAMTPLSTTSTQEGDSSSSGNENNNNNKKKKQEQQEAEAEEDSRPPAPAINRVFYAAERKEIRKNKKITLAENLTPRDENNCFTSPVTGILLDFITELHNWITEIPLEKMHKSRYGNVAFRVFQTRLRQNSLKWLRRIVTLAVESSWNQEESAGSSPLEKETTISKMVEELQPYLLDAFGNAMRIDYGTGHELHFILIIYILHQHGLLAGKGNSEKKKAQEQESEQQQEKEKKGEEEEEREKEERTEKALSEMVLVVFDEYFRVITRVQQHYRLEPAGSHGVWGLDDFCHIPYIVGAGQLCPLNSWTKANLNGLASKASTATLPSAPLPNEIPVARSCAESAPKNLFLRAVHQIHSTKSGIFSEHSPVLKSASSLKSWPQVLTGMIKMYEGEVLGKFLIVQHLLFGRTFKWD